MKKFYLILALCFAFFSAKSQIAYYDALQLKEILQKPMSPENYKAASVVFAKYLSKPSLTSDQVRLAYLTNPFIKDLPVFSAYKTYQSANASEAFANTKSLIGSVGGLDITNFADGLAQFLIERGKQELDIAFIEKFKTFLKYYPEAKIAFPTTISFIDNVASYNYNAMLPALKAAFQKDLNALSANLKHLRDIKNDETYKNCISKAVADRTTEDQTLITRVEAISDFLNKTVPGRSVIGGLIISDGIAKGTNAADVIENLANDPAFNDALLGGNGDILANSVQFTNMISQSIKSTDNGRIWITKNQIGELIKDDVAFQIYLGLLYAQDQNIYKIKFGNAVNYNLNEFLKNLHTNWSTLSAGFKQSFINATNAASDASDNVKDIVELKKQGNDSGLILYADYASSISGFLKLTITLIPDNIDKTKQATIDAIKTDIADFATLTDNLVNSCYYIKSKNYSALVLSTSAIFTQIGNKLYAADADKKAKYLKFKDDYIKYGTFMASILEAKSAADVKAAIEVVALPAGSYSIKQKSAWNISLNGYVGYGFDIDYAHGVYAPVGFSGTFGSAKNGIPITFFVSLIDVGGVVAYRLNDSSTDKLKQEVRLESIISLSGQVIFEIPKTPIGIAAGWRRTPKLFYSDDKTFDTKPAKSVFNISLLIDIPIFTLHNKPF